jgi:hypothetical protein
VGKRTAAIDASLDWLVQPVSEKELFSFGNGSQAIDIAGACFDHFFQKRLEIVE